MANEYAIISLKSAWFELASMPFFFLNVQIAGSFGQLDTISAGDFYFILYAVFDTSLNVQN